jgi:hypothetical protein
MFPFASRMRRAHLHQLSKQFFNESPVTDPSTPQFVVGISNGFLPRQVSLRSFDFLFNTWRCLGTIEEIARKIQCFGRPFTRVAQAKT